MTWQEYLDGWDKKSPAPEGLFNPDPNVHHSYCAYYRDGRACSCFEGRFPSGPEGDAAIESYHAGAQPRPRLSAPNKPTSSGPWGVQR